MPSARAPGWANELGGAAIRIGELCEDVLVGPLLDIREQEFACGIGQRDRPVGSADDDGLTHRPDDRVELRRSSVFRLRKALEPDLRVDPIADVPGDRNDRSIPRRQVDRVQYDLDGDRSAVPDSVVEDDRRGVLPATHERLDEIREAGRLGGLE